MQCSQVQSSGAPRNPETFAFGPFSAEASSARCKQALRARINSTVTDARSKSRIPILGDHTRRNPNCEFAPTPHSSAVKQREAPTCKVDGPHGPGSRRLMLLVLPPELPELRLFGGRMDEADKVLTHRIIAPLSRLSPYGTLRRYIDQIAIFLHSKAAQGVFFPPRPASRAPTRAHAGAQLAPQPTEVGSPCS